MGDRVVVVGAGLAGLACADRLHREGREVLVLEASDGVGGRVRTDLVDGFLVDRGFQILLTAYPTASRVLDLEALDPGRFEPGALVALGGRLVRIGDPLRRPSTLLATALAPVGSPADKLRTLRLRRRARRGEVADIWRREAVPTSVRLAELGFSRRMVDRFLRPFLSGVFLDPDLETSSRMLDFVWRMFASGDAVLPAAGMGAIPAQLATRLSGAELRTGAEVTTATASSVRLADGEELTAAVVVLATDASTARQLTGDGSQPGWHTVCQLAYAAAEPPVTGPWLVLDGEGRGPVTTVCVPSQVCPSYAPAGASLVTATVLGSPPVTDSDLDRGVRDQLGEWFGPAVRDWRLLRCQRIRRALPAAAGWLEGEPGPGAVVRDGIVVCGDHLTHPSIEGALISGDAAAGLITGG